MKSATPPTPALLIDGSHSAIFVGVIGPEKQWTRQSRSDGSALENLFPEVENLLKSTGHELAELNSYIYCEGPGSVLGLRLCAMAMQTWSHLYNKTECWYVYNSLQLTATLICKDRPEIQDALLVSDWKKDMWNAVMIKEGKPEPITTATNAIVTAWDRGPLFHLPQRKNWQKPPPNAIVLEYSPHRIVEALHILRHTTKFELYASGVNVFQKWVPERHRAPQRNSRNSTQ